VQRVQPKGAEGATERCRGCNQEVQWVRAAVQRLPACGKDVRAMPSAGATKRCSGCERFVQRLQALTMGMEPLCHCD
jgi:hypothetical protein